MHGDREPPGQVAGIGVGETVVGGAVGFVVGTGVGEIGAGAHPLRSGGQHWEYEYDSSRHTCCMSW